MRRYKTIKGITLIALVITIIVMLILVGVTINVVLNGNLIENASDAKDKQAIERDKELLYVATLGCIKNGKVIFEGDEGLDKNLPDGFYGTNGKYTKGKNKFYVKENGEVTEETDTYISKYDVEGVDLIPREDLTGSLDQAVKDGKISAVLKETIDGKDVIAVVPVGFTVSNTNGENTISEGLVVKDKDDNEFVWIPVPEISDMAVPQEEGSSNYRGVLYDWEVDATGKNLYDFDKNSGYREPAKIRRMKIINNNNVSYDSQEAFEYYAEADENYYSDTMYQEDFNEMAESVEKYKGFYVGRYETGGFNTSTVVIKAGETGTTSENSENNSINFVNWYKAYKMQKEFANGKEPIGSSMIWGCQWDQIMKFINGKIDGAGNVYVVKEQNEEFVTSEERHTRNLAETGSNVNDKVQNIYDLEGNVFEITLEVNDYGRVVRGRRVCISMFFSRQKTCYPKCFRFDLSVVELRFT